MSLVNLNCCPNFSLGTMCTCKGRPATESPPPSLGEPPPSTFVEPLGEFITLIEMEQIHFETLLPSHNEYLYLKIKKNKNILCATGGLLDDLKMEKKDFIGVNLCEVKKNPQLFGDFICPLTTKSLETGTAYQFCFKLGSHERTICCSIYPCTIPGQISSIDCVIRPIINGFRPSLIDKFALLGDDEEDGKSLKWKTTTI